MRAVRYERYGAPPEVREVSDPVCPPDGVVIAVRATGVCRSDWHAWMGHDPVVLPHVPGHELAGVVAETGPQVTRWQVGDRVTVPFVCGCGRCDYCRSGDAQVCPDQTQPGFTGWGSFAERVAVHAADHNLVALPHDLDDVPAAALGCRFATAYRALTAHGALHDGQRLAVYGAGGLGLSAVLLGVALGARVVAVDIEDSALRRAEALGAHGVVRAEMGEDPAVTAAAVRAAFGEHGGARHGRRPDGRTSDSDDGAHVSIDALGSAATAVASVRTLRRRGRHVQAGLLLGAQSTPPLPMDLVVARELSVHGTHGLAAADYPAMFDVIRTRSIRLESLVGAVIGLGEAPAALMALGEPQPVGARRSALAQIDDGDRRTAGITVVHLPG